MNRLTKEIILVGLFCIPFLVIMIYWSEIPEVIAIHYNLDGTSDKMGSKYNLFLFLLPSYFFFLFLEIYMRSTDYPINETTWFLFRGGCDTSHRDTLYMGGVT